eukprot:6814501-Prymnesium_polylepis.1
MRCHFARWEVAQRGATLGHSPAMAAPGFDEVLWRVDLQAKLLVSERDSHEKHARELERQLQEAHEKN